MALTTVSSERLSTNVKTSNLGTELKGKIGQNKNLISNGAMNVAQRGTSSTGLGASAGYFTLDRYRTTFNSTAGRLTMSQVADVHDGFANAMKFECTTADTSIGASEYFILQQKIEGQDLQQLKKGSSDAEQLTVSFYVKGNASATYVAELYDLDNNRQVGKTFSVTTSWTRVVLTFPADTTGALDDDNNASLQLGIWLHAGSNYTSGTLATSWIANVSAQRAGGITSFFDSTDRTFFLTGLQMEVGSVATDFEHRSFGEDLNHCKRYFQRHNENGKFTGNTSYYRSGSIETQFKFEPEMRATPTFSAASGTNYYYFYRNNGFDSFNSWGSTNAMGQRGGAVNASTSSASNGEAGAMYVNTGGTLHFSADL